MKLSIVILNWNSRHFLERCLQAIYSNITLENAEIIIVDNGSKDGSVEFLKGNYSEIKLIVNTTNKGVGPARNQGMRYAKGEYILILDVDTIVQPGTIDKLIEEMDKKPDVGLAGPKLISPNGQMQYSCRKFPTLISKILRQLPEKWGSLFLEKEELRTWNHNRTRFVGYVIGACQLIRKKAMEQVGFYDERIFYGPEDIDYCLRMWKEKWKVLYVPSAVVVHDEQRITKRRYFNKLFWEHLKGLCIYFLKHKYLLKRPQPEKDYNESNLRGSI